VENKKNGTPWALEGKKVNKKRNDKLGKKTSTLKKTGKGGR